MVLFYLFFKINKFRIRENNSNCSNKEQLIAACLAQSVERKTFNLVVVGSTPTAGILFAPQILSNARGDVILHAVEVLE